MDKSSMPKVLGGSSSPKNSGTGTVMPTASDPGKFNNPSSEPGLSSVLKKEGGSVASPNRERRGM